MIFKGYSGSPGWLRFACAASAVLSFTSLALPQDNDAPAVAENLSALRELEGADRPPLSAAIDPQRKLPAREERRYLHYLTESNGATKKRIEEIARGDHRPGATFVIGAAGIGKSWLVDEWNQEKGWPVVDFKKKTLLEKIPDWIEELVDLVPIQGSAEGAPRSTMPSIRSEVMAQANFVDTLLERYQCSEAPVILFDSLDELHAACSVQLIDALLQSAKDHGRHYLLMGRPEAFALFSTRTAQPWKSFFVRQRIEPVSTYSADVVYALIANARDYKDEPAFNETLAQNVVKFLANNHNLSETISNPTNGRFLAECVAGPGSDARKSVLSAMLRRNKESHGRPSVDDETYLLLLSAIAKKYLGSISVKSEGYFEVPYGDKVSVMLPGGGSASYLVEGVLDHSGIGYRHPESFNNPRYRFTPIWIHRYLAEMPSMSPPPPPPSPTQTSGDLTRWAMAWRVLDDAISAVPSVKYALGVAGIAAAVAIVYLLIQNAVAALVGIIVMFALMVVLFVFATMASTLPPADVRPLGLVLLWSESIIVIGGSFLLLTALTLGWPPTLAFYIEKLIRRGRR